MSASPGAYLESVNCRAHGLALANVQVRPGRVVVLQGPSGCGKTTLLMLLAGFMLPEAGTVQRSLQPEQRVALVPQQGALVHALNAVDNLMLAQFLAGRRRDASTAIAALERLGVGACAKLKPAQCSRGQQQRIALARALVQDPWVLLLDEPSANLDDASTHRLLADVAAWLETPARSVVITTHDARVLELGHRMALTLDVVRMASPVALG